MRVSRYLLAALLFSSGALAQAPTFDPTKIPTGHPGYNERRVQPTTEQLRPGDGTGSFRVLCFFSHMNQDDMIVYPGQQGAAHLHTYFGNKGANYASTRASLRETGASTCHGGILNRSAYWTPSVIDTRDRRPIAPQSANIYYKGGYHQMPQSSIQPMPGGLRMIAGNPRATGPNPAPAWDPSRNYYWECHALDGSSTWARGQEIPPCPVNTEVWLTVVFPQCWMGPSATSNNLNSPDHKSHMSYRVGSAGGACPTTHPIAIPEISINVIYPVREADATRVADSPAHWRLSSDGYSNTLPAGYSAHADWFNGWNTNIVETWVANCVQAARDCANQLLGDGRRLY